VIGRREKRMLPRHSLEEGRGKSAIARKLGIGRDTIHRPVRTGELDRDLDEEPVLYKARPAVATCDAPGLVTHSRLSNFARF
jgi:transposase-like protein